MQKLTKKLIIKIAAITASAVLFLLLVSLAVNFFAEKAYWNDQDTNLQFNVEEYSEFIEQLNQEYLELDQTASKRFSSAKLIDQKYQTKINELNQQITKYFKEVHNIDVSQNLSSISVKTVKLDDLGASGVSYPGSIYISDELVRDDSNYPNFVHTYIHEAVHCLGSMDFKSTDIESAYVYIYEGITQVITNKICEYNNIEMESKTIYGCAETVFENLLKAYPEIEHEIISSHGEYDIEKKLDSLTEQDYARQLETLLNIKINERWNDSNVNFYIQYITFEYLKEAGETNSDMNVSWFFGIRWLLQENG